MNANTPLEQKKHSISLVSREKLEIDGVIDVLDFDSSCVNIKTNMGVLSVEGTGLKIISMSKESEKIYIEGTVDSLFYYGVAEEKKGGLFKRLVR
ncbi:MAG: YabP/YqfC family sporulation protein [Clostridia bacterium]|nr:YabP/YqfC family sporulation protein [Clostridia bacterium]